MAEIGVDISKAIRFLNNNQVVGIPTETVYGLAGNALNSTSITQIFEVKNRPTFDPLICHTHQISEIEKYVTRLPTMAYDLFEKFSPGPITILLPRKNIIPDLVTSGLSNVAFRIPKHYLTLELLRNLDFPLAAPSANPFGYISPTTALHVQAQLGSKIPYILQGGDCNIGVESTIIGFYEENKPYILRLGGLKTEEIEKVTGKILVQNSSSKPSAPGMLESHYAPKKKIIAGSITELIKIYKNKKIGILSFNKSYFPENELILSPNNDTTEAAKNLFSYLRLLDISDCELILTEYVPASGLGNAINDRLKRACA